MPTYTYYEFINTFKVKTLNLIVIIIIHGVLKNKSPCILYI